MNNNATPTPTWLGYSVWNVDRGEYCAINGRSMWSTQAAAATARDIYADDSADSYLVLKVTVAF